MVNILACFKMYSFLFLQKTCRGRKKFVVGNHGVLSAEYRKGQTIVWSSKGISDFRAQLLLLFLPKGV